MSKGKYRALKVFVAVVAVLHSLFPGNHGMQISVFISISQVICEPQTNYHSPPDNIINYPNQI